MSRAVGPDEPRGASRQEPRDQSRGISRGKSWASAVSLLVLAFFLVLAFVYQANLEARATVGEPAPDFSLERLDGGVTSLGALSGRPVVLNFWTTWCVECRTEMPELERLHRDYGERLAVLGVNMRESAAVVRRFLDEVRATYPVLLDRDRRVARAYRITGVPETWILSPEGVAVRHFIGPVSAAQIERALVDLGFDLRYENGGPPR